MEIKSDLTQGNLFKKILFFTIPIILSSILQLLYNACDLIVVGKFAGDSSLAAVGSTGALTNLIVNLFIGISIGANVAVAKAIGKNDPEKCKKVVHTAILFSVIAGVFLTFFGIFTARIWLELMDTNINVIDKSTLYLQIYFAGMVFNMVYNFGAAILRAIGETKKPLYYLSFAGIINVILNLILVIVFKMDVAGVAIGTIVSQAVSAVLIIRYLTKVENMVKLNLKELKIDSHALLEMVLIGLPAGIQGCLFSISNVFVQKAVNSFNITEVVAGNTAASNIEGFIYAAMNAFYQACITFTSQNYGARKIKNCKKSLYYCLFYVTITGIILGIFGLIFDRELISIYADGSKTIEYGLIRFKIFCYTYFLCGIMDVFVGGLRGLGSSIIPMIVSIIGACGFRLFWIYTVFKENHTLKTLYISYPISWILTSVIHLLCYIIVYNNIKKKNLEFNYN